MEKQFIMNNGQTIPAIGFGTWQTPDGATAVNAVKFALGSGYRHIDTAAAYGNEKSVGQGIRESGVKREEIYVTTKLWNANRGYESTKKAIDRSLSDLGLDYLDLYLIHWPANEKQFKDFREINLETWRAMIEAVKAGKIRSIGLSNFLPHYIAPLMETEIQPAVNQIEYHPGYLQQEVVRYCRENGILVEAWSPLGSGRVLNDPQLGEMAQKYGKSVAQLCIRFALQNDVLPLPKSVTPKRIDDNLAVFDFEISPEDMAAIAAREEFGWSGLHPDEVDF